MNPRSLTALLLACALPATAQDTPAKLDGRAFLPADHTLAASIDMAALYEAGIWDLVERSPAKTLLTEFRKNFGFDLAELDRVDFAGTFHGDVEDWRKRQSMVIVMHGSEQVALSEGAGLLAEGSRFQVEKIGGYDVLTGNEPSMVTLRPGLLVIGDTHHVVGVLEGSVRGGVPALDLMPLAAGPKALAHVAVLMTAASPFADMQSFAWYDENDPVREFAARLIEKDGDLVVRARLGFASGESTLPRLEVELRGLLARALEMDELRALRPLLQGVQIERRGASLVAEVNLGDERQAAAALTQLAVVGLVMPRQMAADRAQAAQAEALRRMQEIEAAQKKVEAMKKAGKRP